MSGVLIVSGTDTGVGKTVVAAGLAALLGAHYWKPIQAGTDDATDSAVATGLGVADERILPEAYRLALAASPHRAAQQEGIAIDPADLALPPVRPLIVEGAGGLMVPIRRTPPWLMIDQFASWQAPVLLVARTALGTINHSLLSIAALRARTIPIAGLVFVGERADDSLETIGDLSGAPFLGRLPHLDRLDAASLEAAMQCHINLAGIRRALGITA